MWAMMQKLRMFWQQGVNIQEVDFLSTRNEGSCGGVRTRRLPPPSHRAGGRERPTVGGRTPPREALTRSIQPLPLDDTSHDGAEASSVSCPVPRGLAQALSRERAIPAAPIKPASPPKLAKSILVFFATISNARVLNSFSTRCKNCRPTGEA